MHDNKYQSQQPRTYIRMVQKTNAMIGTPYDDNDL